ncbi:hypothetical protein HK104_005364 [Borealophlyctis nickersoniae]|nr:hypothetical protein HK104_005364 [Borealophlyctis nickersoniae]
MSSTRRGKTTSIDKDTAPSLLRRQSTRSSKQKAASEISRQIVTVESESDDDAFVESTDKPRPGVKRRGSGRGGARARAKRIIESESDGSSGSEFDPEAGKGRSSGRGRAIESEEDEEVEDEDAPDIASDFEEEVRSLPKRGKRSRLEPDTGKRGGSAMGNAAEVDAHDRGIKEPPRKRARLTARVDSTGVDRTQAAPLIPPLRPGLMDCSESGEDSDRDANDARGRMALCSFEETIADLFYIHDDLPLKPDHESRPLWVCADGRVILEAFSPIAEQAQDFLIAVAEPVSRPSHFHEYRLTEYSLQAGVSVGLDTEGILEVLNRLSKSAVPDAVVDLVRSYTKTYAKVKLVLKQNRYWVESEDEAVLRLLLEDETIRGARVAMENDREGELGLVTERAPDLNGFTIAGFRKDRADGKGIEGSQSKTVVSGSSPNRSGSETTTDQRRSTPFPATNRRIDVVPVSSNDAEQPLPEDYEPDDDDLDLFNIFDDPDLQDLMVFADGTTASTSQTTVPSNHRDAATNPSENPPSDPGSPNIESSQNHATNNFAAVITVDGNDEEPDPSGQHLIRSFEIHKDKVEIARRRASELSYPMLEEYDFRQDTVNANLNIDLKPSTVLRPYQEKSLSKMFNNGRGRSGVIVLPCGAGKTLVGVTAACTINKSCLVLCTSNVSVEQWAREFQTWSSIKDKQIVKFTSNEKGLSERQLPSECVLISTYTMVTYSGNRAYHAEKIMNYIRSREWGFLLLDEVHVVPADMFRKVLTIVAAHTKLGLTATLVREDDKIGNLNYLIGPKLFEANWMDLARKGHIANVQACQYLIDFHEARGDKIIIFSDNVFALKHYATKLDKPFIYGGTSTAERMEKLQQFRHNAAVNTLFLSKVGDTSIDLPEATCLIQISSHYGSRRQEAQRLGRILRAKRTVDDGVNAYFYTLVSKDTEEVYYSGKRQQFLIDQGYHFKVITQLEGVETIPNLVYTTPDSQLELLHTVLTSSATDWESEDDPSDDPNPDDVGGGGGGAAAAAASTVVRRLGTMKSLSGGDSMAYMEFSKGRGSRTKRTWRGQGRGK